MENHTKNTEISGRFTIKLLIRIWKIKTCEKHFPFFVISAKNENSQYVYCTKHFSVYVCVKSIICLLLRVTHQKKAKG